MTPEEEAQRRKEHEELEDTCIWPYVEHDESDVEWDDNGFPVGTCRRCDAEFAPPD